ncbi:MAG TPA: hypothetical protein VK812_14390 [Candidatus Binatus sp.]|nr:hypothetical protein [Candidatus Binatus sp.]
MAAFFETVFAFANFLAVFRFRAVGFAGDFVLALFFEPVDFFLLFFGVAIRAV